MQRRETQVTRFRELDTVLHGLPITNLTDQDYVRRLAQRVLERGVPGFRVDTDLSLRDHTAFVRMNVLDRVLNRDNVAARVLVAVPDHRGKRR